MIATARAAPVHIEKHGHGVFMVIAVGEHGRLKGSAPDRRIGNSGNTERA